MYCWYCELQESSVVTIELALQVYCNLVLKIIHCSGFGGVGLFYQKVFPHRHIFVFFCIFFLYLFSVFMGDCNIIVYIIFNLKL